MKYICLCCEKDMGSCYTRESDDRLLNIYAPNGTILESTGNYGSGVFDIPGLPYRLVIYLCDDCAKKKAHLIKILEIVNTQKVGREESLKQYMDMMDGYYKELK